MKTLRKLVEHDPSHFRSAKKETADSLSSVRNSLGFELPPDLNWLLLEHGYGDCVIVPNLAECIADTQRFRESVGLPSRYFVLEDLNDAGVILLDTTAHGAVVWIDNHCLGELQKVEATKIRDADYFPNLAAWAKFKLEDIESEEST